MIWHIVRFDMRHLDAAVRQEVEASLAELGRLDEVAWLRVARDVEDPAYTGLLTGFADADALAAYRVHPDHLPVLERLRELEVPAVRLDVATDDDPAALP